MGCASWSLLSSVWLGSRQGLASRVFISCVTIACLSLETSSHVRVDAPLIQNFKECSIGVFEFRDCESRNVGKLCCHCSGLVQPCYKQHWNEMQGWKSEPLESTD